MEQCEAEEKLYSLREAERQLQYVAEFAREVELIEGRASADNNYKNSVEMIQLRGEQVQRACEVEDGKIQSLNEFHLEAVSTRGAGNNAWPGAPCATTVTTWTTERQTNITRSLGSAASVFGCRRYIHLYVSLCIRAFSKVTTNLHLAETISSIQKKLLAGFSFSHGADLWDPGNTKQHRSRVSWRTRVHGNGIPMTVAPSDRGHCLAVVLFWYCEQDAFIFESSPSENDDERWIGTDSPRFREQTCDRLDFEIPGYDCQGILQSARPSGRSLSFQCANPSLPRNTVGYSAVPFRSSSF